MYFQIYMFKISFKIILLIFFIPVFVFAKGLWIDSLANDNRCMTFHHNNQKNQIQKNINMDTITNRPLNQKYIISPSGLFWIHYDTTGIHSVDLTDRNKNSIPDFVDSVAFYADYVYKKEVQEMGFISAIGDSLRGGSDSFDIYLFNIGDGEIFPDSTDEEGWGGIYGYTVGELTILPNRKFQRLTSYIVMDNDFSPLDSIRYPGGQISQAFKTFGVNGVKITLAHEFQHAIQFRYGTDDQYSVGFAEMSSVMMEYILFPEIKDYMQYVRSLFKQPEFFNFAVPNRDNGYRFAIFPIMLVKKYGMETIRKMWELVYSGLRTYKAIDSSLILKGTSLDTEWVSFMDWIYHTGYRTVQGEYFQDASIMPLFTFQTNQEYSTDKPSTSVSGGLQPYQIRFDRIVFKNTFPFSNDTLNMLTTHLDTTAAIYGNYGEDSFTQLVCSQNQNGYTRIFKNSPIPYYYNLSSTRKRVFATLIEIPSVETFAIASSYPNPFKPRTDENIYFPAPENALIDESIELVIYNENLQELFHNKLKVFINKNDRVLSLDFNDLNNKDKFSSGVYLFRTEKDGKFILGKFALINE